METIEMSGSLKFLFQRTFESLFNEVNPTPSTISRFCIGSIGGMATYSQATTQEDLKYHADQFLQSFFKHSGSSIQEEILRFGFKIERENCPTLPCKEATVRMNYSLTDTDKLGCIDAIWTGEEIEFEKVWLSLPEETRMFIIQASEIAATYVIAKIIDATAPFQWMSTAYEIKGFLEKLPEKLKG